MCVWPEESTNCRSVKEESALEAEKGSLSGESREQRPGGENSMDAGGQVCITKQVSVITEYDERWNSESQETGKGFGETRS